MMTREWVAYIFCLLGFWQTVMAQREVPLTVSLRDSAGTPIVGERVVLEQFPAGTAVSCTSDAQGLCAWMVTPGLYQLLFARSLDEITAVAVAEGGLRGLGITVGETPITYSFTFHSDGHVYFDAAPTAAQPQPIIPATADLHSPLPDTAVSSTATATDVPAQIDVATDDPAMSLFPLLLAAGAGMVVALIAHRLTRRSSQRMQKGR